MDEPKLEVVLVSGDRRSGVLSKEIIARRALWNALLPVCTAFLTTLLLAAPKAIAKESSLLSRSEPGPAAASAYALLDAGEEGSACRAFAELLRGGSADPWAYRGAALCAVEVPAAREHVLAALDALAQDTPLVLFARADMGFRGGDPDGAEEGLRRVLEKAPEFALAWNLYGAVAHQRGDHDAAIERIEKALSHAPEFEVAKRNLALNLYAKAQYVVTSTSSDEGIALLRRVIDLCREVGHWEGVGRATYGLSIALFKTGRIEESLATVLDAREVFSQIGSKSGVATTYLGTGVISANLGHQEQALSSYRKSLELFTDLAYSRGQAQALTGQGDVLLHVGKTMEALASFRRAKDLYSDPHLDALGDKSLVLNGEASALARLGRYDKAIEAYNESIEDARKHVRIFNEAEALRGKADVLSRMGKVHEARATYGIAKGRYQQVGFSDETSSALAGEAGILSRLGDYEEALQLYAEAHRGSVRLKGRAISRLGEADTLLQVGEDFAALSAYQEAHDIFEEIEEPVGEGRALMGQAAVRFGFQEYESALSSFKEARHIFTAANVLHDEADALLGEGRVYFQMRNPEKARASFQSAREIYRAIGDESGEAKTLTDESLSLIILDRNEEASQHAAAAVEKLRATGPKLRLVSALVAEANARFRLGEREKPISLAEEAIRLHSQWRGNFLAEDTRINFDESISGAYELLILLLRSYPARIEEALDRLEESKSRVLLDLLTPSPVREMTIPSALEQEKVFLRSELARLAAEIQLTSDPSQQRDLQSQRRAVEVKLESNLYQSIAAKHVAADLDGAALGSPIDTEAMRRLARDAGPIVMYQSTVFNTTIFLVSGDGRVHSSIVDSNVIDLEKAVKDLVYRMANPTYESRSESLSQGLWLDLVAPLQPYLPESGPVTFVPHGPLHSLPFEALIDPESGRRLFEIWDVTISPSASALDIARRERHRKAAPNDNLVAFASGVGLNLPEHDVRTVARLFPVSQQETFGPEEAELRFYEEHAARARYLLIASRGVHVQGRRRGTYLEIKPTPGVHDGRLSAAEIATIPIDAELVTLAACDTDRGEALLSDERLTLTRSFLVAGAAAVLATRWRVPEDRSTTQFLIDFYEAYRYGGEAAAGMRKDEALTRARRKAVLRGDPAQTWAAWVLVGDAR